jgi:hypothetical protein
MSLVLSGSDGLSDVAGRAATPAIRGTDANTGIFFPAADTTAFSGGGTEFMRINSSGNVGIGTNAPGTSTTPGKLAISASGVGVGVVSSTENGTAYHFAAYNANPATPELSFFVSNDADSVRVGNARGPIRFYAGSTTAEEMRLDTSGRFLINTTATPTGIWNTNAGMNVQYGIQLTHTGNANIWRQLSWSGDTGDSTLFFPGGTSLGAVANVASLSSAGSWINASDGRQKINVIDIRHGLAAVLGTKPRSYNRTDTAGDYIGFVAQELKTIIPEVVQGSEATSYGVDYGSLVAVAFKAIQEQQAIITALTARVEALEGTQP